MGIHRIRRRLHRILETAIDGDWIRRAFDRVLRVLILTNVFAVAVGTV